MSDYFDVDDFDDGIDDDEDRDAERDIGALHPEWSGVFETRMVYDDFTASDEKV